MSAASAKAQEPSMDEILASIRRIIADDQDPVKGATSPAEPDGEAPSRIEHPPGVVLSEEPSDWSEEVAFQPISAPETGAVRDEPAPVLKLAEVMAASPRTDPPRQPDPTPPAGTREPRGGTARLVSTEATASVNHAFSMLSHTVLTQNARTLEDLVKDLLTPMLKTWLDDNLPPLVERLVRAEIERVSRGGR